MGEVNAASPTSARPAQRGASADRGEARRVRPSVWTHTVVVVGDRGRRWPARSGRRRRSTRHVGRSGTARCGPRRRAVVVGDDRRIAGGRGRPSVATRDARRCVAVTGVRRVTGTPPAPPRRSGPSAVGQAAPLRAGPSRAGSDRAAAADASGRVARRVGRPAAEVLVAGSSWSGRRRGGQGGRGSRRAGRGW